MQGFLIAVLIICALLITIIVILQPSKDGGLGGLASGSITGSVLGAGRNEFLAKATWWLGGIFLISCISLAYLQTKERNDKLAEMKKKSISEQQDNGTELKDQTPSSIESPVVDPAKKDSVEEKIDETKTKIEEKVEEVKTDLEKAGETLTPPPAENIPVENK